MDLNEVLDMTDSVNPNHVSIRSYSFSFLINTNGSNKDIYIGIVSNMLELPPKGILYTNQVRAASHFYYDKLRKLGGKQRLLITYVRESFMFISGRLYYLPVRFSNNEDMESYLKVPLTPD